MDMTSLRVMGRATQGVRVINLKSGVIIASVAKVPHSEEEEEQAAIVDSESKDGSDGEVRDTNNLKD
jgi:DNA gyrase subunit A